MVEQNDAAQTPRGPLAWLETARHGAVQEYFAARGQEPSYEKIVALAPPYKYVNAQSLRLNPIQHHF